MNVGSGFGMAALMLALLGMFMPVIGLFIGWLALVFACVAALCGDKGYTVATIVMSAIAFLFFTPSLWLEGIAANSGGPSSYLGVISFVLFAAPIVCMILFSTGRFVLARKPD
jgi:hypothetical protein